MRGQPDAVVRLEKHMSRLPHLVGSDLQHHRFAVALAHRDGRADVLRQVYMMPASGNQALLLDRFKKARGGAVIQEFRRRFFDVLDVDAVAGVPLDGAYAAAVRRDRKALFVVVAHDVRDQVAVQVAAVLGSRGNELIDVGPAFLVECQADGFGRMALECDDWPAAENIHVMSSVPLETAEQWLEGLEADGLIVGWPYGKHAAAPEPGAGFHVYTVCWE